MRSFVNFKALLIWLSRAVKQKAHQQQSSNLHLWKATKQGHAPDSFWKSVILSDSKSDRNRDFWREPADSQAGQIKIWLKCLLHVTVNQLISKAVMIHPDFLHNEGHSFLDKERPPPRCPPAHERHHGSKLFSRWKRKSPADQHEIKSLSQTMQLIVPYRFQSQPPREEASRSLARATTLSEIADLRPQGFWESATTSNNQD